MQVFSFANIRGTKNDRRSSGGLCSHCSADFLSYNGIGALIIIMVII